MARVDFGGIDAGSDGQIGQDFAGVSTHDDQLLGLPAADEEAVRFGVDRHPDWRTPGRYGPACDYFACFEVHDGYFVFVLEIDIDLSFAVGG